MRPTIQSPGWRSLIAVLACMSLAATCNRGSEDPLPEATQTPRVLAPPYRPEAGAVFTVVSTVDPGAPAATLDYAAALHLRLESGPNDVSEANVPVGSEPVVLSVPGEGVGRLDVTLLDPSYASVLENAIQISELRGHIGRIDLVVSAGPPADRCAGCGDPEILFTIPGLHETHLYWSAVSRVPTHASQPVLVSGSDLVDCLAGIGVPADGAGRSTGPTAFLPLEGVDPIVLARTAAACPGAARVDLGAP